MRDILDLDLSGKYPITLLRNGLLTSAQSWIGMSPDLNCGHGSGIVQILATAPYRNSQDPFEQMLLMTIAGPVVIFSAWGNMQQALIIHRYLKAYSTLRSSSTHG